MSMQTRHLASFAAAVMASVMAACATSPPPPSQIVRPTYRPVAETPAPLDSDQQDLATLNRVSWGVNTPSAQALAAQGLAGYLASQLTTSADDGLPENAQLEISGMDITRKSIVQINNEVLALRAAAQRAKGKPGYDAAQKAYQQKLNDYPRQAATRSLLRDLYSKNQLKEQLTWFWMNHFNVSQQKGDIRVFVADYEESAIRPHVLGKFRDLLAATVFHPAMLQYLDNAQNSAGHINENYAREIMELHTLGVGSGYTQKDVQELARILTGVGVNATGKPPTIKQGQRSDFRGGKNLFEFNPNRHDFGDKVFLGAHIKGEGLKEVLEAITILSIEPPTARHISRELAQYFCCDEPPEPLLAAMTATFRASDGDIASVLKTMFDAPEFKASLGHKFKDPIHYAVSALRAAYGDTVILNAQPLLGWLNRLNEPLYGHQTPDGYPLSESYWSGSGQMETRFEIARVISLGRSGLFKLADDKAPEPAVAPNIQQARYYTIVGQTLGAATKGALAQTQSAAEWNLIFFSSPEFMRR
jgi:uncharacterized protein (DUF1800 family)